MTADHESLVNRVYDRTIRPHLPRKIGSLNSVDVRFFPLFDIDTRRDDYEAPLCNAIEEIVETGDDVAIVGGGWGVSSVIAARKRASVTTYEAGAEQAARCRETANLNGVDDWITIEHAIVGDGDEFLSPPDGASRVNPADIPDVDVLVMDCEGAELSILRGLAVRPRAIIVEAHAVFDSPESSVRAALDDLGYDVVARGVEEKSDGVVVLAAIRE